MKPVSPELITLLESREFYIADLWTFTLAGGTILRYCAGDADITANGLLYSANGLVGPYFDRQDTKAKCHWKVGTGADSLVVDCLPGSAEILGGAFLNAIRAGVFDGAEVMLERAYMPSYGDTRVGVIRMFVGRVAEIDAGASIATFNINSHLELLNLQLPRNLTQPACTNNLGDALCTIDIDDFSTTGTISSGSTVYSLNAAITGSFDDGTFDQGKITFTSGDLSGYSATVKSCVFGSPDVITMLGFLPSAPAASDTFTLFFGCNKSYTDANGCAKFSNTAHFRGQPFVPQPTVAV